MLLEEGLEGEELSYIILTDGNDFIRMAPARDHKRAFDNDEGPEHGRNGRLFDRRDSSRRRSRRQIIETIVRPTLDGLRADGMPYRGFLYFGLMLTPEGPKVLEYNCRLGDPETEAVLLRADFDLAQACMQAAQGELGKFRGEVVFGRKRLRGDRVEGISGRSARRASRFTGLDEAAKVPGAVVFHAGTRARAEQLC